MKVRFIAHKDSSNELLRKIGGLKKQHWNYSVAEHLRWFNANLLQDDIHVCVFKNADLVGYLTLQNIEYVTDDEIKRTCLGIGGVSVDKNYLNKGFGNFLVQMASAFIRQQNTIGILLCKDGLVGFYQNNNWIRFEGVLKISETDQQCNLLSTSLLNTNKLYLSKSF